MYRSKLIFRALRSSSSTIQVHRRKEPTYEFWAAALGTCIFFSIYHDNDTTFAESPKDDDATETKKNSNNNVEKQPWYRRYPSHLVETFVQIEKKDQKEMDTTPDNETLFQGQCLERQLYKPAVPYPAWDYNWDGKLSAFSTLDAMSTREGLQASSATGTTRHIVLVRHGQYEEYPLDDRHRCLTLLGRKQAQLTGRRIAQLIENIGVDKIKGIYTSDLLRAKQTAWIMMKEMPKELEINHPDPDLNEALPATMIPMRPDLSGAIEEVDATKERVECAFRRYFYRADPPKELLERERASQDEPVISASGSVSINSPSIMKKKELKSLPPPKHEFEIIVCHGNIIRYMTCRALQIPPEAWLRFSVFNCSITYLIIKPNGYVSARFIGDIGHMGYNDTTFSGAHGFLWS